jgi:hypothetical protein
LTVSRTEATKESAVFLSALSAPFVVVRSAMPEGLARWFLPGCKTKIVMMLINKLLTRASTSRLIGVFGDN